MKRHCTLALLLTAAATVHAQIGRPRPSTTTPLGWMGGSLELTSGFSVNDGTTGSTWTFGSSTPLRLSLEKGMSPNVGVGIAAIGATMPLRYSGGGLSTGDGCGTCDAHATMRQALAILHYSSGLGSFGPAGELGLGWTGFSGFESDVGSQAIGPSKIDWDFTVAFAYGLSFAPTPSLSLELLQNRVMLLHQRDGLSGSSNSLPRYYTTRLGLRYRFGR